MASPKTRTDTPYNARMLAMADRLFRDFDHLPVGRVFTAIATAHATVKERHRSPTPDPNQVEQLARDQLRRKPTPDPPARSRALRPARSRNRRSRAPPSSVEC